jgi:hypothetical protein
MQSTPPPATSDEIIQKLKPEIVAEQRLSSEEMEKMVRPKRKPNLTAVFGGEINAGSGGKEFRLNPVLFGSLEYKGRLRLASEINSGYTGDLRSRSDPRRILSETHIYPFYGWPVHPACEIYGLIGDGSRGKDALRCGVEIPIKAGRYQLSADILPFTASSERNPFGKAEVWLRGSIKLGKGVSVFGAGKYFVKDGKDTKFGKAGIRYDFGNKRKDYVKIEARDWPTEYGKMRGRSIYVGFGRRF